MTETRFYEPARLGTPPESSFSLKLLDTNLVEVIVNRGLPCEGHVNNYQNSTIIIVSFAAVIRVVTHHATLLPTKSVA